MFEEYINSFITTAGKSMPYVYVVIGMIPVLAIIGYIVYYLSFNRVIVIKERVGQAFDFELSTRLVEEDNKHEGLKSALGELGIRQTQAEKKIRAIPTITKSYRGKVFQSKGKYYIGCFRFLQNSLKLKVFGNRFWNIAGSRKRIEILQLSPHIYAPLVTAFDQEAYNKAVTDENYIDWVVHDIEEDHRKYQSMTFWDKYGSAIIIMVTMLLCIIFVMVVFRNMKVFADAGSSGAKALADACTHEFIQRT
jgi:hypothetical protein